MVSLFSNALVGVAMLLLMLGCEASGQNVSGVTRSHEGPENLGGTRHAVRKLLNNLETFEFVLTYHGSEKSQYKPIHLSVPSRHPETPATYPLVRISREQAAAIVGHMAADGFIERGMVNAGKRLVPPSTPYATMSLGSGNGEVLCFEHIPWSARSYKWHGRECPSLLDQLRSLQPVLVGDAAAAVDGLVSQLEKQWK